VWKEVGCREVHSKAGAPIAGAIIGRCAKKASQTIKIKNSVAVKEIREPKEERTFHAM